VPTHESEDECPRDDCENGHDEEEHLSLSMERQESVEGCPTRVTHQSHQRERRSVA
jgi:hypothetical protein